MPAELSSREAFENLIATLSEKGLAWVVNQVRHQIELGKPITRRAKELYYPRRSGEEDSRFASDPALRPGREVQFRATVEYTDDERLQLLLSAIQQAVLNTAAIEEVVTRQFPGLTFVSEEADVRIVVGEGETDNRAAALLRLQTAIDELNAAIGESHGR
jgi:hypothetical protein